MKGVYQVWHPMKPEASFPEEYMWAATVEAINLFEAADKGGRHVREGDVVVDPSLIVYSFEGNGLFGVLPLYRDHENFPALRAVTGPEDRAFASAVLGIESPTPDQVERIISNQQLIYAGSREDQAIWQAYDDYYSGPEWEGPSHDTPELEM